MKKRILIIGVICTAAILYFLVSYHKPDQFIKLPYIASPTISQIKADNEMYLVAYGPAESTLLELHKDGTYKSAIRAHLGSLNSDEGTWAISDKGDIALKSSQRFHDIYVDDILWISVDSRVFSDLPEIKQSLINLLKNSKDELLPYAQIAGVKEYQAKYGKIVAIHSYTERPVKRETIRKLIENIEEYQGRTEQNVFYWRPITYKSFLFLVNTDNHHFSADKLTQEIVTTIDNYKINKPFVFSHHNIFAALTPEYFRYESRRLEPFKFVKMFCQ